MSYRPLPDGVTIKRSPIEGLGLYATEDIPENTFIGLTHILDERFENNYLRTPLGGFYNHSDTPNVRRMITNKLPTLKFGDPAPMPDDKSEVVNFNEEQGSLKKSKSLPFRRSSSIKRGGRRKSTVVDPSSMYLRTSGSLSIENHCSRSLLSK